MSSSIRFGRAGLMIAAIAALLTGCAAGTGGEPVPAAAPAAPPALDARIGELPPQQLAPGQCGLFLWGRTVPARLVLFAAAPEAGARIVLDGQPTTLTRTSAEGNPIYGQFPRQSFTGAGAEVGLTLQFERTPDLVGGARVPRGVLELRDADGWSHVMPVAGLIGCQPG